MPPAFNSLKMEWVAGGGETVAGTSATLPATPTHPLSAAGSSGSVSKVSVKHSLLSPWRLRAKTVAW